MKAAKIMKQKKKSKDKEDKGVKWREMQEK
jgi:hypothetical protein